jgi:transposase-like protein
MQAAEFDQVVRQLEKMSLGQIRRLRHEVQSRWRRVEALAQIEESRADSLDCPHCGHSRVQRWGYSASGLQRRRCRNCHKTFGSAHGTPLAHTRKRDTFWAFTRQMLQDKPMSCRRAARWFGIHRTTAWRWRQLVLRAVEEVGSEVLAGIVEADETFRRESRKGSREWVRHHKDPANVPRPPRRRWYEYRRRQLLMKRGLSRWQVPVLTIRDRSGGCRADVLRGLNYQQIGPLLHRHISADAVLCSDKAQAYAKFAAQSGMRHERVRARRGERIKDKTFHIQNINALHDRLDDFLKPFRGPATRYLTRYVGWFLFRDRQNDEEAAGRTLFQRVITMAEGQHAIVT